MNNWKYYGSTDNVFWDSVSIDKPSKEYIDNMNWTEININLHHISPYLARTQSKSDQYGLIKAINIETKKELYWMLKNINMYTNKDYNLEYELDTWSSYNLKLLDNDINILVDRHQDYDDNCLKFDDEILNNVDVNFHEIKKVDYLFDKKIINNNVVYETNNKQLIYQNQNDVLNSHFCLVLNDNDVNDYSAYTFIPILGLTKPVEVTTSVVPNQKITMYPTTETHIVNGTVKWTEFNVMKDVVNWYYDQTSKNNKIEITTVYDRQTIDLLPYIKKASAIENIYLHVVNTQRNNVKGSYLALIDSLGYMSGLNGPEGSPYQGRSLLKKTGSKVLSSGEIYLSSDSTTLSKNEILDNSLLNINKIISSQQYANKINGIYLIPNVLQLTDLWTKQNINGTNVLSLKVEQQGKFLQNSIKLNKSVNISNLLQFNNNVPIHKIIYRYFKCNWLNCDIDMSHFINNNNLEINGIINFTNSFNIIHNNKNYLLDNRVLSLPAQQPLKSDNYNKLVAANMNSINTGYAITKQQAKFSGIQSLFNSITSGVIGSAISGNPLGMMTSLAGGISGVIGAKQSVKNYEKQTRAKFADANNVQGNELLFSATRDNLWSHLLTANEQFESIMIKELTEDSIIQLNNTLLLYGVYNPKYFKLNNLPKTTKHLGFYYAKLNSTNFNQIFSKYINEPREIKDIILSNFEEFRVWDKVPSIE